MSRALPRANFSSPRLVRLLANAAGAIAAAPAASAAPKQDFAARLGQWLRVADAIRLHAVLDGSAAAVSVAPARRERSVAADVDRVRTTLTDAIVTSCSPEPGAARIRFPAPPSGTPADIAALYAPFQRFHLAHQREMEQRLGPLRLAAREALASASPGLKQLADVDAIVDATLSGREHNLLATVPALLEHRFNALLATHWQALTGDGTDDPVAWLLPGGWLARYREELKQMLLAELDLRLQPIMGLVEALN